MNQIKLLASAALVLTAISPVVNAEGFFKSGPSVFNYNFADFRFIDSDGLDGFGIDFSADFNENFAWNVSFSQLSAGPLELDTLSFGAVYHIQSGSYPQADWVLGAGLERLDINSFNDNGILLSAVTRYAFSDALELNGGINFRTTGDSDFDLSFGALYEVSTGFSALAEIGFGDDTTLDLGIRYYWR